MIPVPFLGALHPVALQQTLLSVGYQVPEENLDGLQPVGEFDLRDPGVVEGVLADAGQSRRQGDLGQIGAVVKEISADVSYMVVSEAGASVYSASKLAAKEFPDYDVSLRSAVSRPLYSPRSANI